jgi:hypothetical protein
LYRAFSGGIKVNLGVSDPIEICGRSKLTQTFFRSSESPWPAPISNLIKQWIGSPCSSTCGVLISFALYSKKAYSLINPFDGMTVGTEQARRFRTEEISYG